MENLLTTSQNHFSKRHWNGIVKESLIIHENRRIAKKSLIYGILNFITFLCLYSDAVSFCPLCKNRWYYVELFVVGFFGVNSIFYLAKFVYCILRRKKLYGTAAQKKLLNFNDNDNSFHVVQENQEKSKTNDTQNSSLLDNSTSFLLDASCLSYLSRRKSGLRASLTPERHERSLNNFSYRNNTSLSPNTSGRSNSSFTTSSYPKVYSDDDIIADEKSLNEYLSKFLEDEQEAYENLQRLENRQTNSFWNWNNATANLLRTSVYQLSPSSSSTSPTKQKNEEKNSSIFGKNSEVIRRISTERLEQYVANLRRWLSQTILKRITAEIQSTDDAFKTRGFHDMQIGAISIERLKKTIENQQFIEQCMPRLPLLVPFLDMSSNQEYLVQRIKALAEGTCIADYRWNSGSSYKGVDWDEHLPTDSAILFHLFCVYLDSQLLPLPQNLGRPFYSRYVIQGDSKRSENATIDLVKNRANCAILCTNPMRPKFNFISDKELHTAANDRNNLFYVIIQFLIYMRERQHAALEGVNLGKSGINILCIIES